MRLSEYTNATTETEFIALRHVIEYLMHQPHEPNMHSRNNIFKTNEILLKCFFESVNTQINQTKKYYKFLHKHCNGDHARDIIESHSVTSTSHPSNGTI